MAKTLTKADIISTIQCENSVSANKSADIIETLLEIIKRRSESGYAFRTHLLRLRPATV